MTNIHVYSLKSRNMASVPQKVFYREAYIRFDLDEHDR